MASPNKISVSQLNKLVGTHNAPVLIDVRDDEDFASDPQYIPTAIRCSHLDVAQLTEGLKNILSSFTAKKDSSWERVLLP